jgi:hypothetical protein
MLRPQPYCHSFVALQNIPYSACDGMAREASHSGGVLGKGQLVWTTDVGDLRPNVVNAFVEELGVVSLDPRWLVPADVLRHS